MARRLAIVIPDLRGGGAEHVALALTEGFLTRGYEVDLVMAKAEGELIPLLPPGAHVVDLGADRMRRAVRPLSRYLKQRQPVGLLAIMWPITVVTIIARILARSGTRIVTSDHGILSHHYADKPLSFLMLWLTTKLIYPFANARIGASRGIADDLAELSGMSRRRIDVIANPVALPPDRIVGRREAEGFWGDVGARILSVGVMKREKDQQLLLHAFAKVRKLRPARLIILGDGPLREELLGLAKELGIGDDVMMPGFRANCWPFYASADIFVLSSKSEGFGNVLVEAMAVGLPVVSTGCAGPLEVLDNGAYGQIVPIGDANALAEAMSNAIARPGDAASRKVRALQFRPEPAVEGYLARLLGHAAS